MTGVHNINVSGRVVPRLIERSIEAVADDLVLLAPTEAAIPDEFVNVSIDPSRHRQLLRSMQSLRGGIYLQEGNVTRGQLTADGRHVTPEDEKSWHLLMIDGRTHVRSCALYIDYTNTVSMEELRVRNCPLAMAPEWSDTLRGAVESEIARARQSGLQYAELGGWAITKERRGTPEGLLMALATYGLSRALGGALGMTTANVAHGCSAILRRLGGSDLEFDGTRIPPYFDPRYNTNIELLRFDSRYPNARYSSLIDLARYALARTQVIAQAPAFSLADVYHLGPETSLSEVRAA